MSERRPWWDDELIEAVRAVRPHRLLTDEQVYHCIATVEDWHSRQSGCEPPCTYWADAGEQRVRAEAAEAERDVLRKTINKTEIALHKPWKYDCACCERIGRELGAWGGPPAWETRALDGDNDPRTGTLRRMEQQQAAIRRVRKLCKDKSREVAMSDPLFGPPSTLAVTDILRALDGPDE